jgi:NDP-sugar pyrophosphorylase family protein
MSEEYARIETYFPHLGEFAYRALVERVNAPWEAVAGIVSFINKKIDELRLILPNKGLPGTVLERRSLRYEEAILVFNSLVEIGESMTVEGVGIVLEEGVVVEPGAIIKAPAIIGAETEVRQGAYLRGGVLTGRRCTLGHTTEVKNSVFMNHSEAGHFAYVGDSILGSYVNLGAGTKIANLQLRQAADKLQERFPTIVLRLGEERVPTEMSKLGAILGDYVETGCNSVTAPGVLCGAYTWIYANISVAKGYYPPRSVIR